MGKIRNISRRKFITHVGLASGGLVLACNTGVLSDNAPNPEDLTDFNPNVFVQLKSDGSLNLIASRSEMGNGVRTSMTSIIADEMEADWSKVNVVQGTGDSKYGDQNTDGSRSVRYLYDTMRNMGAMAKTMLISAAAQEWQVPVSECTARDHEIHHTSGKKIGFGELVDAAGTLEVPENYTLKSPKDFKFIGKNLTGVDTVSYSNGSAVFGMDKRLPDMKFAAVQRCPVTFGKVKSYDKSEALKIEGVEDVIEIERVEKPFGALGGVAVIASNTWAAFKGKEALKIEWDLGDNAGYSSDKFMKEMTEGVQKPAKLVKNVGAVNAAFKNAAQVVESTYQLPHLAHATMETPNAVAWVQGNNCEVWAPVQSPQDAKADIVDYLSSTNEEVTVNVTFLGGGFGRKSKSDFVMEAVIASKKIGKPVQVVWTREDDIRHGYYHTTSAQYMKASLDKNGAVTGWLHRFAMPSIMSTFQPGVDSLSGFETSSATGVPYEIENMRFETAKAASHVRIGWLRSVINIPHGYAINVFADELAHKANQDPLEFRLKLIGSDRIEDTEDPIKYDTKRLKNVLKKAASNAGWGKTLPEGHAFGFAVQYSFYSYVASVVEVSVINDKLKVHNVYTCIDCGLVVNRNTVMAQMEGSAIFGMSIAYYGNITAKNGAIEQSNYHDYKMLRINDTPKVHVEIIESDAPPTGVGEPGVPVIAPAIVNAIFNATGKRYHNLPLSNYGLV